MLEGFKPVSTNEKEFLRTNYTEKEFRKAIKESFSYRQALSKLQLKEAGGNYRTIKEKIQNLDIDTSHFKGKAWSKGRKFKPKRHLSDYLSNKFPIQSYKLKKRLLKEKIFKKTCHNCNLSEWLENPIPLELDHIDGNYQNNNLSNLRLLCPNCHALTPTYRAKNIRP